MITIKNTKTVSRIDLIIFQLKLIISELHLTKSEWTFLAYAYLYGDDFKIKLLKDEVSLSAFTVNNMTSKFIKLKLLTSNKVDGSRRRTYVLNPVLANSIVNDTFNYDLTLTLNEE